MARRWTPGEDTAVRLAAALDYEHGGQRLRELAARLGRTEAAIRPSGPCGSAPLSSTPPSSAVATLAARSAPAEEGN